MITGGRTLVPCNGCTACCQGEAILLMPEAGDVVEHYLHQTITLPHLGEVEVLQKTDGHCIYLVEGKCSIWERAPVICKEFDCRKFYLSRSRAERRRMVKSLTGGEDVMKAGKERLDTLSDAEREAALKMRR